VYGLADLHTMLEVMAVDAHNRRISVEWQQRKQRREK
jgi:hypothetical protein